MSPHQKSIGAGILEHLAAEAQTAEVTDAGRRVVLDKWAKAHKVVEQAQQMLADAIRAEEAAARAVVKKLGLAPIRYNEQLYVPRVENLKLVKVSVPGPLVFLKELPKKER